MLPMILTINSDFYPHAAFISMILYWKNTVFSVMCELRCKFILVVIRYFLSVRQSVVHPKKQTRRSVQITSVLFFSLNQRHVLDELSLESEYLNVGQLAVSRRGS